MHTKIFALTLTIALAGCFDSDAPPSEDETSTDTGEMSIADLEQLELPAGQQAIPGQLWGPCVFDSRYPHGCEGGGGWGLACATYPGGWICAPQLAVVPASECPDWHAPPLFAGVEVMAQEGHCMPMCSAEESSCGEGLDCHGNVCLWST